MKAYWIVALSLCPLLFTSPPAGGAGAPPDEGTLRHFSQAVEVYAQLHRRLEQNDLRLSDRSRAREILASSNALAARIRAARISAREGDVFLPEEADKFRMLITRALYSNHYTPEEMVAAGAQEAPSAPPHLKVNTRFPWAYGAAVWPCVLVALPPLPEELQYRIVGRDLVLVDVHANLVVDILRDAVQPTT